MNIKDFSLTWRLTGPNQYPLSESVLEQLVPFDSEQAQNIEIRLSGHAKQNGINLELYQLIESNPTDESCSTFLTSLGIIKDCKIIISWDSETALSTIWDIFENYWEAFCYPGSDDIIIFPINREWLLVYYHYGLFEFGKSKRTRTDQTA